MTIQCLGPVTGRGHTNARFGQMVLRPTTQTIGQYGQPVPHQIEVNISNPGQVLLVGPYAKPGGTVIGHSDQLEKLENALREASLAPALNRFLGRMRRWGLLNRKMLTELEALAQIRMDNPNEPAAQLLHARAALLLGEKRYEALQKLIDETRLNQLDLLADDLPFKLSLAVTEARSQSSMMPKTAKARAEEAHLWTLVEQTINESEARLYPYQLGQSLADEATTVGVKDRVLRLVNAVRRKPAVPPHNKLVLTLFG